jgi:hypothetical protein
MSNMNNKNGNNNNKMFSMIFDGVVEEEERDRRNRRRARKEQEGVIMPPSMRGRPVKRKSRKYIRPIFKEPGSKLPADSSSSSSSGDSTTRDEKQEIERSFVENPQSKHRVAIIHGLRDEVNKKRPMDDDAISVILPSSRTQDRLRSVVGRPSSQKSFERSRGLESRILKSGDFRLSNARSSVTTRSNISSLETRRLVPRSAYSLTRPSSDLSTIRREVNKLAVDVMLEEKEEQQKQEQKQKEEQKQKQNDANSMRPQKPSSKNELVTSVVEDKRDEASDATSRGGDVGDGGDSCMSMWSETPSISTICSGVSKWQLFGQTV